MRISRLAAAPTAFTVVLAGLPLVAQSVAGNHPPVRNSSVQGPSAPDPAGPRFGVWRLRSDNPPPYRNVMTYAPHGDGGMSIEVAATNAEGNESVWSYVTMFDGVFRSVEGLADSETAVEPVDERSTRISNRRNGVVYQVIINTLSEDGNRIDNEYVRLDAEGRITGVNRATYDRVEEE